MLVRLLRQVVGMPILVSKPERYLHLHPTPNAFQFVSSLSILPVALITWTLGFQVRFLRGTPCVRLPQLRANEVDATSPSLKYTICGSRLATHEPALPFPCPQLPLHHHWWTTLSGTAALLAFVGVACEAECAFPCPAACYVQLAEACSRVASWVLPLGTDPVPPLAPVGACIMVKASLIIWMGMAVPIVVLSSSKVSSRAIFLAQNGLPSGLQCGWKREVVTGLARGARGLSVLAPPGDRRHAAAGAGVGPPSRRGWLGARPLLCSYHNTTLVPAMRRVLEAASHLEICTPVFSGSRLQNQNIKTLNYQKRTRQSV